MNKYISELKNLLHLAFPLMLVRLLNDGKGFVDIIMVGNIDKHNLSGLSLAVTLYFVIILFLTGMSFTVVSVLARMYAKKDLEGIKHQSQQNMYFHLFLAIFVSAFFINSEFIFQYLNLEAETKQIAADYLKVLGWIHPITCLRFVFRPLLVCFKENKTLLKITIVGFLLNVPLNYVLIFGKAGFPELGAVGSAYATAFCTALEVLCMMGYCYFKDHMNIFSGFVKPKLKVVLDLFKLGLPAGLTILSEYGMFAAVLFMLSVYGEEVIGAHQIAATNMSFIFIVAFALNTVLNQRVSYNIGARNFEGIKITVLSSCVVALLVSFITISITYFFAENIIDLYTDDQNIIKIAVQMFTITMFYQLFDNFYISSVGILRAFKENTYLLKVVVVSYWFVGFPVGYILSTKFGGNGYWMGFVACFVVASTLNAVKIYKLVWQESPDEIAEQSKIC